MHEMYGSKKRGFLEALDEPMLINKRSKSNSGHTVLSLGVACMGRGVRGV